MNTHIPEEYGGAGRRLPRRRADRGGALVGLLRHPDLARLQRPRDRAGDARRVGGAQEGVPRPPHRGAAARVLLPDRARGRLRRRRRCARRPSQGRQAGSSTARSASSPTAATPTGTPSTRRPTRTPATAGSPCFIVPRDAGVVVDKHEDKMGQRASNTATITFPDVEIPLDHLIGEENDGLQDRDDDARPHAPGRRARWPSGIARAAFEFALDYATRARPVRRADRDAPGDPVHDRRHGDRNRGRAAADVEVGGDARPGRTQHAASPRTPSASPPTRR